MDQQEAPPASSGGTTFQVQRKPFFTVVREAMAHMREASAIEGKRLRGSDMPSTMLLPLSCLLLVAASWIFAGAAVKAVAFLFPLGAFAYYVGIRMGIIPTLSTRQAFMMWHILMGTFLLGFSSAVFVVLLKDAIVELAKH